MLTAFDLCLGACGVLLTLAGTAIDFVVDRLTGLVDAPLLPHTVSLFTVNFSERYRHISRLAESDSFGTFKLTAY